MKNIIVAAALVIACAVSAVAADVIVYPARTGNVTFDHKAHSSRFECKLCHGAGAPSKIAIDKDVAHKLCKGCHAQRKEGPTRCVDCHKK